MIIAYGFFYLIYMGQFNYSIRIVLLEHIFNEQILLLSQNKNPNVIQLVRWLSMLSHLPPKLR